MDVKEEQPKKQLPPKLVTEEGMSIDVKEEQDLNVLCSHRVAAR